MGKAPLLAPLAAVLVLTAPVAHAQVVPSLELRNFYPPTDPEGAFYLEPSSTAGAGQWNVGAWLSYGRSLVIIEDADGNHLATPVAHQLSLDYLACVGLTDRLALGISLPTVLYQTGDDVSALLGADPLPRSAIGDAAFTAKATLLPLGEAGGYGLAALGRVTAPTGDRRSYLSDGAATGELRLLVEANLVAASLRATAGFKARSYEREYVGEQFSHNLPWGLGVAFLPRVLGIDNAGRWQWLAEMHGAVAVTPKFGAGAQSPMLASLGTRYTMHEVSAIAGLQLPIGDAVGIPEVRVLLGVGWAPRFYDADGDGIEDDEDECPDFAEDLDGFEDSDGCPDSDNDRDSVADNADQCQGQLEDQDGHQDEDGCPDPDNDGDGIEDRNDACPDQPGPEVSTKRGCPLRDTDADGVYDHLDRCPRIAEDRDEFSDEDGCPDPDNDRDRILDRLDACPLERGPQRSDPALNGCPNPDADGDSYDDQDDQCPDQPEDFDGVDDEDGCLDDDSDQPQGRRAKPLITVEQQGDKRSVRWRSAPQFRETEGSYQLADESLPTIRALAQLLRAHPRWVMAVGVKPAGDSPEAQQEALTKAFALVQKLRALTHRDEVAEPVGWAAVREQPGAQAAGVGVLILETPEPRRRRRQPRRKQGRSLRPPAESTLPAAGGQPGLRRAAPEKAGKP
jgi:OOP family OmpA-OmpF porin